MVVINNQVDRIDQVSLEIERRGFPTEHVAGTGGSIANGNVGAGSEESLGREVIMGGTREDDRNRAVIIGVTGSGSAVAGDTAVNRSATEEYGGEGNGNFEQEVGIYL